MGPLRPIGRRLGRQRPEARLMRVVAVNAQQVHLLAVPLSGAAAVHPGLPIPVFLPVTLTAESIRARIILTRDPDGDERCVCCYLCAAVCPTSCISMEGAERADGRRIAPWFRINFARCIYCGLCEEACPTLAIQLTPFFEFCEDDILKLVAEKEDLLVDHGGKNTDYNYYRYAGVTMVGDKGTHINEAKPVDLKTNLP